MYSDAAQLRRARFRRVAVCDCERRARRSNRPLGTQRRNERLTRNSYHRSKLQRGWIRWFQRNGSR